MLMTTLLAGMPDLCHRVMTTHVEDGQGRCVECAGVLWPCELQRIARAAQRLARPPRRRARRAEVRFVQHPREPRHRAERASNTRLPRPSVRGGDRPTPAVRFLQPLPQPRSSKADTKGNPSATDTVTLPSGSGQLACMS
jgi:hypothetical protein